MITKTSTEPGISLFSVQIGSLRPTGSQLPLFPSNIQTKTWEINAHLSTDTISWLGEEQPLGNINIFHGSDESPGVLVDIIYFGFKKLLKMSSITYLK